MSLRLKDSPEDESSKSPEHLQAVVENGRYIIEILKPANVRDSLRIHLPGGPLTEVTFGGTIASNVEELKNEGLIRVAILVARLPDGRTQGVATGLILPQELSDQSVLDTLRNIGDAVNLDIRDKFAVMQPVQEGRPHHSNPVTFSLQSAPGVTIDQDGNPPDDMVERNYDNRTGIASPNQTVFMMTTEDVVNACLLYTSPSPRDS